MRTILLRLPISLAHIGPSFEGIVHYSGAATDRIEELEADPDPRLDPNPNPYPRD